MTRTEIAEARYLVVKVGSSAVATKQGIDRTKIDRLVEAFEPRLRAGHHLIVVSSGAIASGLPQLGLTKRPKDLATKQAAASVGQMTLTQSWRDSFARFDKIVGQILLTAQDMSIRAHHTNAARTFTRLRQLGAVALVNENDTLATQEIRFGDNDRLAALVAHLSGAEALVLLSDVEAVYTSDPTKDPTAQKITDIGYPPEVSGITATEGAALGTGGMRSKLSSALLAAEGGIPVLLTSAQYAKQALSDASVGTVFTAAPNRLSARKFWLRFTAQSQGQIILDSGAVTAVTDHRRSLLPAGIISVSGDFHAGDVVELCDQHKVLYARGITGYDSRDIEAIKGKNLAELSDSRPVVHADDLVPLAK